MIRKLHIQIFVSTLLIFNSLCFAIVGSQFDLQNGFEKIRSPQPVSEYLFRTSLEEPLMSIKLLGAVNKPGLYHLPFDTDILTLLTLAGGSSSQGDLSQLIIRKKNNQGWLEVSSDFVKNHNEVYEVDIEKIMKLGGQQSLHLNHDDFVFVPQKSPVFSPELIRGMTLVSVFTGIILSGILIQKNSEKP